MDLPLRSDRSPRPDNVEMMPTPARTAARLREDAPVFLHLDPPSFAAEQYRTLAVQVEERLSPIGTRGYILTVTSPEEAAGKTLTSLNRR